MHSSNRRTAGLAIAALAGTTLAFPRPQSAEIADAGLQVAQKVAEWFGATLFTDTPNAWDYTSNPNMCAIRMSTQDGANCFADVTCADGVTNQYNQGGAAWSSCFLNGQQFFNDPRIGDFSIKFTRVDGDGEGQGLTYPVLQLANVGNWMEFPVHELSEAKGAYDLCKEGSGSCTTGSDMSKIKPPFICEYAVYDFGSSRYKKWLCGMPVIGKGDAGTGLDSNGPVNTAGYAPGWCGVHITQHQKPNPATDSYSLDVIIKDNNEAEIGRGSSGPTISLGSKLPYTVEMQTQALDDDPILIQYAGQGFDTNDAGHCSVGAYDSGSRQIDCGFSCA